jgi:protein TonB
MLSEDDYPSELKRRGVEGKVVVEVLIDASGTVRGVTLVQGSEAGFNDLVLSRLKESKFRPAYDSDGNPVACRLRLPLAFRLSN